MLKRFVSSERSQKLCTGTMSKKARRHFRDWPTRSSQAQGREIINPFQKLIWEEIQDALLAQESFLWCLFDSIGPSRHAKVMAAIIQAHLATAALMATLASPM